MFILRLCYTKIRLLAKNLKSKSKSTTYIGNYIANKGMRGAIENSALVLKES